MSSPSVSSPNFEIAGMSGIEFSSQFLYDGFDEQ